MLPHGLYQLYKDPSFVSQPYITLRLLFTPPRIQEPHIDMCSACSPIMTTAHPTARGSPSLGMLSGMPALST